MGGKARKARDLYAPPGCRLRNQPRSGGTFSTADSGDSSPRPDSGASGGLRWPVLMASGGFGTLRTVPRHLSARRCRRPHCRPSSRARLVPLGRRCQCLGFLAAPSAFLWTVFFFLLIYISPFHAYRQMCTAQPEWLTLKRPLLALCTPCGAAASACILQGACEELHRLHLQFLSARRRSCP